MRLISATRRMVVLTLAISLAFCACSNEFAPYSKLDRLRVLAIQGEPATPLSGQTATLSALVYAPEREAVSYHWSWCPVSAPASSAYACALDEVSARTALAPSLDSSVNGLLPSFDLGTSSTATFVNPFALSALINLCAVGLNSPVYAQAYDCEGGFPVTVVLDVATATSSLRAGFVLRLPSTDPPEINHNPNVAGLELAGLAIADDPGEVTASPGKALASHADLPTDDAETRSVPASEGGVGQRLERLSVSWFSDTGAFDQDRTSFIDGIATLAQASSNSWTAPTADAWPTGAAAEFAVVVRDDRGGVGWLVRNPILHEAP